MSLHSAFADKLSQRTQRRARDVPTEPTSTTRPSVLVVDDEPEITRSVAQLLEDDYTVLTATSVDDALELLRENPVAVILTDQRMPGGTGIELLVRSIKLAPEATRILFTGYSDISAVIDAINEGHVYRYIAKPWRPEELKAVLAEGFDRHRLVVENLELLEQLTSANRELERRVAERTQQLRARNEELSEARGRLELMSRTDALTGLINRRWLDEVLARELARAETSNAVFCVIMADVDLFKDINDKIGHVGGDQVLRSIAEALATTARATDAVARYGGEEIAVLLRNTEIDQAHDVAERMRVAVRMIPVSFRPEPLTASFGVAQWSPGDTVATLMANADEALYEAKRTGRDKVVQHVAKEQTMAETTIAGLLADQHDAVLAAAKARSSDDGEMASMAAQRGISQSEMSSQIIDFWLQAIRTDLTLGGTAVIDQNLSWLMRFRDGHGLVFHDRLVMKMFNDVSFEIEGRLHDEESRAEYAQYADTVRERIVAGFPDAGQIPQ